MDSSPLRQFQNGENFVNNFIHCSDMARGTPLPYSQFSNGEKMQDVLSPKTGCQEIVLRLRMIQAHVCLKCLLITREIEARIAWSVADVKIYVESWRRFQQEKCRNLKGIKVLRQARYEKGKNCFLLPFFFFLLSFFFFFSLSFSLLFFSLLILYIYQIIQVNNHVFRIFIQCCCINIRIFIMHSLSTKLSTDNSMQSIFHLSRMDYMDRYTLPDRIQN